MKSRVVVTCGDVETDFPGFDNHTIQAAIDSVAEAGGGEVLLSAGEYILKDSVHLKSNIVSEQHPPRYIV